MFKKILKFIFVLIISGIFFWFFTNTDSEYLAGIREAVNSRDVPGLNGETIEEGEKSKSRISTLSQPKGVNFSWEHNNVLYSFSQELHQSTWDFYNSQPKVIQGLGKLPDNWEEKFYGLFLEEAEGDNTIAEIVAQLKNLGDQEGLDSDEMVELAVAFVQSIPYDDAKAERILKGLEDPPRYPYEVLYEQKGVCSGKSFLLVSLLRELGYGSVLLEYEEAKHMAVGIKCPEEYSTYDSGYCYVETTNPGHRIGIVPYLNLEDNSAMVKGEMEYFNENGSSDLKRLEGVKMFQEKNGKTYRGIVKTIQMTKEITVLEETIFDMRNNLIKKKEVMEEKKEELEKLEEEMEEYKAEEKYAKYNSLVPEYNDLANSLSEDVEEYNAAVDSCNQKIKDYNRLVKDF